MHKPHNQLTTAVLCSLEEAPNSLQQRLEQLHKQHQNDLLQTLAHLLYCNEQKLSKQQQLAIVTSWNFILRNLFRNAHKNVHVWRIYQADILGRPHQSIEAEFTRWAVDRVFGATLALFLQSFEEQFMPIMEVTYPTMPFNHKLLLYMTISNCDIASQNRTSFYSFSLQSYMGQFPTLLDNLSLLPSPQHLTYLSQIIQPYLSTIHQALTYLHYQSTDSKEDEYLVNRVCASQQLFLIVNQAVFLIVNQAVFLADGEGWDKDGERDRDRGKFGVGRVFGAKGNYVEQESVNKVKAVGLQILCMILRRYSHKSSITDFDTTPPLGLAQTLVPSLMDELSSIPPNILSLPSSEPLTIACLQVLHQCLPFIFLNSTFSQLKDTLFWGVVYGMLSACGEEMRLFEDDPQAFIAQSQTLVEKDEDDPDKVQSCKTWAGFLLQRMVDNLDGALTWIVRQMVTIVEGALDGEIGTVSGEISRKFKVKISLQACFTVLQVLSAKVKGRADLIELLRNIFIEKEDKIIQLKLLQKARAIQYLNYNFSTLIPRKHCYMGFYNNLCLSLQSKQPIPKLVLQFYETYSAYSTDYPGMEMLLEAIVDEIPHTKNVDLIETVARVLGELLPASNSTQPKQINSSEGEFIQGLVDKCAGRIFTDNQHYIRALRKGEVYSNLFMLKCITVLRIIGKHICKCKLNPSICQSIMAKIWPVFDLFQFIYEANYDEDLIKLFDTTLSYMSQITGPHMYSFLPYFADYHKKSRELGRLFYTYQALLKKGQHFLKSQCPSSSSTPCLLTQIVQNILIPLRQCSLPGSLSCLTLLQYVVINFGACLPQELHQEIFVKSREFMEEKGHQVVGGRAAGYNLWILGSVYSEAYDLGELGMYDVAEIQGYHAKLFSMGICSKIQSLVNTHQEQSYLQKIGYLLKKSLKALQHLSNFPSSPSKPCDCPYKIQVYESVNAFEKIKETLIYLKRELGQHHYQALMGQVEQELGVPRTELRKIIQEGSAKDGRVFFRIKEQ